MNRRVSRFVMLGTALVLAFGAAGCIPRVSPNLPNPSLGVNSTWVTGLSKPWDIAFLPSGLPVYTQNDSGVIAARVSDADTQHVLGEVSNFDGSFNNAGEGGLMGLTIDPRYNTNRQRVCLLLDEHRQPGGALHPEPSRITGNRQLDPDRDRHPPLRLPQRLPRSLPADHGRPVRDDGRCRASDRAAIGDIARRQGAAHRHERQSVAGQPVRAPDLHAGHRNPQGIAFRPYDFTPYSVEHGPDVNDEVNKLKLLGNAGWNPNSNGSYNQSVPMTNPGFQNVILPTWVSGGATVAPSGATFLTGKQWKGYENALAVAVLKDSELLIMKLNLAGTALVQAPTVVLKNGVRLRSAVQGPDGNLYITTDADAIWRVVPG